LSFSDGVTPGLQAPWYKPSLHMPSLRRLEAQSFKLSRGTIGWQFRGKPVASEKGALRKLLEDAKCEYAYFGGWKGFKSGEWLWLLIHKSFKNYRERATVEYFYEKYGTADKEKLAEKLIAVAAKNASTLGAITGAAVSADEIVAIVTAGEGGIGLPANVAIAATALSAEAISLGHFQLQLVVNLGKLCGAPLDPNDPEDAVGAPETLPQP
jgi:hypothetical protein